MHQVCAGLSTLKPQSNNLLITLEPVKNRATKRSLALYGVLTQVESGCRKKNIDVLSFKGPTLSALAYGNINSRFCRDLDLLVSEDEVAQVQQELLQFGFQQNYPNFPLTPKQKRYFISTYNQMVFVRKNPHTVVELHWRLFQNKHLYHVRFNDLKKSKQEIRIGEKINYTLPLEELIIYLAIHGAKHRWEKLYWLLDFYRSSKCRNVDWDLVFSKAQNQHVEALLIQAIHLCRYLFDAEFLSTVKASHSKDKRTSALINEALDCLLFGLEPNSGLSASINSLRYRIKLKTDLNYRLGYFRGLSVYDFDHIKLPDSLFGLYYLLRPFSWALRSIDRSDEN